MASFKESNKVDHKSTISLAVQNTGRQDCESGYLWGPGQRDHYLIHYISAGRGTYEAEGKTYHLKAGDVFIAYPGMNITYRSSDEDPWSYEWVGFTGSEADTIMLSTDFSREQPVLYQLSFQEELHRQMSLINEAFGSTLASSVRMTGELYLLLHLFVKNSKVAPNQKKTDAENVRRAMEYIASNYSYQITVEDIASYIGVSRSTLFRQFQRIRGLSPKEYLDRYRIQKAIALLEQTDLSIAAVAVSVGYDNGLYFSKVFRKYLKETPTGYRNSHLSRPIDSTDV